MRRQPIIKATIVVSSFWWIVLTLHAAGWNLRDLLRNGAGLDWHWTMSALLAVAGGTFCGIFATVFSIWFDHRERAKRLQGKEHFLVTSSIGDVPLHYHDLRGDTGEVLPITEETVRAVPEIRADKTTAFLTKWHAKYDQPYAFHARLMSAVETILMKHRAYPATHVAGGHGGRSLLDHSLLVSWYMDKLAPHHKYDGKIKVGDVKITIPLRSAGYKFDDDDPLVAIAGLAHDIGKIECYLWSPDGKLVGSRPNHDRTGAQVLARMPEYWDLPREDREVLHTVMAYYHHPSEVPTEDGYMVIDDRIHALLELLIQADTLASKREAGQSATAALSWLAGELDVAVQASEEQRQDVLWNTIKEILARPSALNGAKGSDCVGYKRRHPQLRKDMLYLMEEPFIDAICAELGVENYKPNTGNPVGSVTRQVLSLFADKGILYMEQESGGRSYLSALYVIEMYKDSVFWADSAKTTPAPAESRGAPKWKFGSGIVIDVEPHFTFAAQGPDYQMMPVIGKSRLGNQGKRVQGRSVADEDSERQLTGTATPVDYSMGRFVDAKNVALKRNADGKENCKAATQPSGHTGNLIDADSGQGLIASSYVTPSEVMQATEGTDSSSEKNVSDDRDAVFGPLPATNGAVQSRSSLSEATNGVAADTVRVANTEHGNGQDFSYDKRKLRIILISIIARGKLAPIGTPDEQGRVVDKNGNYIVRLDDATPLLAAECPDAGIQQIVADIADGKVDGLRRQGSFLYVSSRE